MYSIKEPFNSVRVGALFIGSVVCASAIVTSELQAQALEEIVVTAQRREESLQEVPVSVIVMTGEQIAKQGFKNLDDLVRYSATVNMSEGGSTQETTIRGFGSSGASMTLQSATPMFVDGIHFGSVDMVKNAFMDTERLEVLNGPQPLHFGMDASAGAFNIMSKRPTQEWEGDMSGEFGNDGKREVSGAFGGPITDTLGIRVAASHDVLEGVLKSRVDGSKFPQFNSLGGRMMLQWTPNDRFNMLTKFEINRQRNGGEIGAGCIAAGDPTGYGGATPISGYQANTDAAIAPNVYVPASAGGLSNGDRLGVRQFDPKYTGKKCFDDEYGVDRNGPWARPLITNITKDGASSVFDGFIDIQDLVEAFHTQSETSRSDDGVALNGVKGFGTTGKDAIDSHHVLFDATYTLANGVNINSQTAYVNFGRTVAMDGRDAPFSNHVQHREVTHDQHSQQIRIESPTDGYNLNIDIPGGLTMNYLLGGFYQQWDKDVLVANMTGNFRTAQRVNNIWEDAQFWSGFWGLNFKFMDDQLSVQAGGRYSDVSKEVFLQGYGAAFIYDEVPCDSAGTNSNPATCTPDPHFKRVHPNLTTFTVVDPVTGRGAPTGTELQRKQRQVRVDSPRIFLQTANMNNLWTQTLWNVRANAAVPLNYRGANATAVGLTAPVYANANGPFGPCTECIEVNMEDSDYSSQIVISLTPDRFDGRHTMYGKFSEGFKGSVTDTGTATLPVDLREISFGPEYSESWEIGVRGSLYDGRVRYGLTGFMTEFRELQTTASLSSYDPADVINQQGQVLNAGRQKTDGVEFNLDFAATENLVFNLASSLLDARYTEFDGTGCNDSEVVAASINAVKNPAGRSVAELKLANEILGNMGPLAATLPSASEIPERLLRNGGCRLEDTAEFLAGNSSIGQALTYNREGFRPALAPAYKVVLGGTYTRPVFGNYEFMFNAQGYVEGEKVVITGEFDRSRVYPDGHWDVNLMTGIGPSDGSWRVLGFVRNLMEDRIIFKQEYDLTRAGIIFADDRGVSKSSFQSYGLRFEYNFE